MARKDLVRRTQEAGWRSAAKSAPVSVQKSWYDKDMQDIGRIKAARFTGRQVTPEIEGLTDFLTRPLPLIFLALFTFAAIFISILWWEGRIASPFGPKGAEIETIGRGWIKSAKKAAESVQAVSVEGASEDPAEANAYDAMEEQLRREAEVDRAARAAQALANRAAAEAAEAAADGE